MTIFFRIKYLIVIALFGLIVNGDELSDCKCGEGQQAQKTPEGVKCLGILTKIIVPCNVPRIPTCRCTGDATASVNSANEGSYCVQSKEGKEVKRWDCENKEEWAEYKKNNNNQ